MPPMPTKWMATLRFPNTGSWGCSPELRRGSTELWLFRRRRWRALPPRDGGQLGDDVVGRGGAGERAHRGGHAGASGRISGGSRRPDRRDASPTPPPAAAATAAPARSNASAFIVWWSSAAVGSGIRIAGRRMIASSASVSAPARATQTAAWLSTAGMSSMYARTSTRPLVAERRVVDLHLVELVGAGLVDDGRKPPARVEHADHARRQLVDRARALAAAQDHDRVAVLVGGLAATRSRNERRTGLPR